MQLSQQEENKNRAISAGVTFLLFALLILFLVLFKIITPNPPFPESGGGGGQELALGMMNMGTGDIDFGTMGQVQDVVAKETPTEESIVTAEGGEQVNVTETKPEQKDNKVVITPVTPEVIAKEKTAAETREKFLKSTGKNGGGTGNNGTPGDEGNPDGDPFKNGTGGTGTGNDGGNGAGTGPGGPNFGKGGNGYGFSLGNRKVVTPPRLPNDTQLEGKVVVDITVDGEGNVIEANPNGRGTTTSSADLKMKAKQAALATKFNVDGKYEEQTGTITIIFAFQ